MSEPTASELAARQILGGGRSDPSAPESRPATGERARLLELIDKPGSFTDEESEEFAELAKKSREGTLGGQPARTVTKRESVIGEGDRDGRNVADRSKPLTNSEQMAERIHERTWDR